MLPLFSSEAKGDNLSFDKQGIVVRVSQPAGWNPEYEGIYVSIFDNNISSSWCQPAGWNPEYEGMFRYLIIISRHQMIIMISSR